MKALICIYQFFNLINESKGNVIMLQDATSVDSEDNLLNVKSKVDPSKLYGVEVFWKIVQEASDKEVMEKSRDILNRIYTQFTSDIDLIAVKKSFIETYLDRLAKTIDDPKALEKGTLSKMIKLIEDTIEESERRGTGGIKSHLSILKGNIINLLIKNTLTSGEGIPKSMEVEAFGNISVWELKAEIGKYTVSNPECIKMSICYMPSKDTDHGKILSELVNHDFMVISAEKKEMPEVPIEPLLNEDKTLTEPAKRAFTEIFKKYSVDGKMSMHNAAELLSSMLDKKDLTPNDKVVKQFFKNLDKDRDNYLTLDDALQFYALSLTSERSKMIKDHLSNHGFRNDLKNINEVPLHKVDVELLPRVLLSKNIRSFELLFKALDQWGSKADFAWILVCRLCTNEETYKKLKDIDKKVIWEDVINTRSSFRLLYCLQIVMGIFRIEEMKEWKQLFISKGGFSFLVDLFVSKNLKVDLKTMEKYDKIALVALIRTINMFVEIAIFTLNKDLVTSCSEYLKLTQPEPEKQKQEEKEALLKLFEEKPSNILFPRGYNKKPTTIPSLVITEEQANIMLNDILSKELWKRQLNILADLFWNKPNLAAEDIRLGNISITLLRSCLSFNSSMFPLFKSYTYEDKDFDAFILFGLVNLDSQEIRTSLSEKLHFQSFIYKDTVGDINVLDYFLQFLLHAIIQRSIPREKSEEFFKLLCNLIDIYYKKIDKRFDIGKLIEELIGLLKEELAIVEKNTMLLVAGIIESIRKIVEYEPLLKGSIAIKGGILNELFNNLLFATKENHNDRKPLSKKSYESALKLILALCKDDLEIQSILYLEYIDPFLEKIKGNSNWAYNPEDECRSKYGYAGIKNLGCICYMISILQQFYMVPPFRYGILSIESGENVLQDEDMLYQLRFMFSFLESSERQACNPKKFCNAYKDLDGYPTNTSIQQDAHEFLNMSFERMESLISQTAQRYLISGIFGGRICSQIICKGGCGNIRKNYEDFNNLSVEVKGFRVLSESLNKFVAGDKITDYMCEYCNKKVNVLKRTSISELPNVLIIHLQRLIFNYDTLRNDKINSRLEFPKELSMEPYTMEGIAKKEDGSEEVVFKESSYYNYKLAGVVIHVGFADAGHYYSFINTNRKSKYFGLY